MYTSGFIKKNFRSSVTVDEIDVTFFRVDLRESGAWEVSPKLQSS